MGEVQGSLWSTLLYITLFTGMVTLLFWALDIMHYNSTMYTIEDNIKAGNLEYINSLEDKYNVCGPVYDTNTNCSGIIETNKEQGYVKYQLSFDGLIMKQDASTDNDSIVLLPY